MTRHKKDNKFLERKVIDEAAMLAYLNNELDAQEKQQFEKLLESDPFALEALEGLQAAKKPVVSESLSYINKKVRDRAGLKGKKAFAIHWTNYAWAAVILGLLLGVGSVMILYMGNDDKNTAVNQGDASDNELFETKQELKPAESTAVVIDTMPVLQQAMDTTTLEEDANETEATNSITTTTVTGNTAAPAAGKEKSPPKTSAVADKAESEKVVVAPEKNVVAEGNAARKADTKVSTVTMDDAMKSFNSGNYKESSELFEAILQKEPSNADALYFSALGEYINGNYKRSEKNFDKLLKDGTKYAEGSKWYKANILLQKGKKEEARKLLNELSQSGGSYKERAVKKMAEIHF